MCKPLILICFSLLITAIGSDLKESEKNDFPKDADVVMTGKTVEGLVHGVDFDYYTFIMPSAGAVTMTVSGFPSDCGFEIGAKGFDKSADTAKGEFEGKAGQYFHFTVKGTPGKQGWVYLKVSNSKSSISSGDWAGITFSDSGPWYTLAGKKKTISSLYKKPVNGTIAYYVTFTAGTKGAAFRKYGGGTGPVVNTKINQSVVKYKTIKEDAKNTKQKPMNVNPGNIIEGMVHFGQFTDSFKLSFPFTGTAEVTLSGQPKDVSFQVISNGFGYGPKWTDGKPGLPVTHKFNVKENIPGVIEVRLTSVVSSISSGNWGAVMCSKGGDYYFTPFVDKISSAPATHNGKRVLLPIRYKLTIPGKAK